jgi:putative colanic acid biosynthesis acetyltransferase WcaF
MVKFTKYDLFTNNPKLNVSENRAAQKWSKFELVGRMLWECFGIYLFRYSPRQMWIWRRAILRLFGATVSHDVHIYPSVRIAIPWTLTVGEASAIGDKAIIYSLGPIMIGNQVTISQHVHLCAGSHEHQDPAMPLVKPAICIGDGAWICADSFIGPGVIVGPGSVVGARAVVTKNVAENYIVAGNPAQQIGVRKIGTIQKRALDSDD